MADDFRADGRFEILREIAEELLKAPGRKTAAVDGMDFLSLVHELEVHQVELEIQNEELRRAKSEAEAFRDEFFELYDSAPVAYVTLNKKGIIERANQEAYRMLKGQDAFLPGNSFMLWIYKEDLSIYFSFLEGHAARQRAGPAKLRLLGKEGVPVHVRMDASYKSDKNQEHQSWRLTLVDITEIKKAEQELGLLNRRLREQVKDLQDFAYIASHDLQEPLRKVSSFAEMLTSRHRGSLNEQGLDYLERIQGAAKRMRQLINGLLEYSRVGSKARPFSPVELDKVLKDVLVTLEFQIERTRAKVEVEKLPRIEADPLQMEQLFQNLIGNALKFAGPAKAPLVRIFCQDDVDEGSSDSLYRIYVEDNGIGFKNTHVARIFQPFERLHGRGAGYEGVGMGLAICKKIVERHGGNITARGTPGEGATFEITLPEKQNRSK